MIRVHALQTGSIRVKRAHQHAWAGTAYLVRMAAVVADPFFTEPLPVYAWLIEHPDGPILVDTGESTRFFDKGVIPPDQNLPYKLNFRPQIRPEEEIGPLLKGLGYALTDIRRVILTHTHFDHSDSLYQFPHAEVQASPEEIRVAHGWFRGALPALWPPDLHFTPVEYAPEPFGPFEKTALLTRDGRIRALPTQGHTAGHQSLWVEADQGPLLIAGDLSFHEQGLIEGWMDGVTEQGRRAQQSQRRVRELLAEHPAVYLPSHDPESAQRLTENRVIQIG